ncbi:MAG TPA: hypothetical protein VNH15_05340 [Elusimicrobiota bacterium]|nr:hypothetical protein [Elusimicrobiota bacterium]
MNSSKQTIFRRLAACVLAAGLAVPAAAQGLSVDAMAAVSECSGASQKAPSISQAAALAQPCLNALAARYASQARPYAAAAGTWITVRQGYVRPWASGPVRTQIVVPGLQILVAAPAAVAARVVSGLAQTLNGRRSRLYGYPAEMNVSGGARINTKNAAAAIKGLPQAQSLAASAPAALDRLFDDAPAVDMPLAAAPSSSVAGGLHAAIPAQAGIQSFAGNPGPGLRLDDGAAARETVFHRPAALSASTQMAFSLAEEDFLQTYSVSAAKSVATSAVPVQDDQQQDQNSQGQTQPDYHHHPHRQPDYEPYQYGEAPYSQYSLDPDAGWQPYVDIFGATLDKAGAWSTQPGQGTLTRGGQDVGTQGTNYALTLTSSQSRDVYRLYWRWDGRDCDPNDSTSCVHWRPEFQFFADHSEQGQSSSVNIKIHFAHDKALLPWVKETIGFSYDGGQISVDTSGGAFQYTVLGPTVNQQTGQASVVLVAGAPILRPPEADKVHLSLDTSNGGFRLMVTDDRASYYAGETLEIAVRIKQDSGHWWKRDQTVVEYKQNGPLRVTTNASEPTRVLADLSYLGSGKFYISDWSFSRADSKISSADWMDEGKGGSVRR